MRGRNFEHFPERIERLSVNRAQPREMRRANRTRRLAAILLTAFLALGAAASAQEVLTLDKALEMAAEGSYTAQTGALEEQIAEQKIEESLSLYYPRIDASVGHVHLDNDPAFKFGPATFPAGEQLYWKWDISLQQTLWDFGRRRSLLNASESSRMAVRRKVSNEIRMKQAEVTAIYMQAVTLADQISVVESRKKSLEDHLKVARNLYEQGVVTRNDLLRTEVALRSLDDAERELETARRTVLDKLLIAAGMDVSVDVVLEDPAGKIPPLSLTRDWSEEELKSRALSGNEGLKALDEKIAALEDAHNFARKESYPYLVGAVGHSYEQNRYFAYPHVNKLFLGVSMNLFDGGAKKAKAVEAGAEVEKARRERLEAEREVVSAIMKAYRDYRDAVEQHNTAKLNLDSSSENLRIIEDQYKEGLLKTTDYLEAENLLAESRFRETESLHKVISCEAAIVALMGEDLRPFFAGKN